MTIKLDKSQCPICKLWKSHRGKDWSSCACEKRKWFEDHPEIRQQVRECFVRIDSHRRKGTTYNNIDWENEWKFIQEVFKKMQLDGLYSPNTESPGHAMRKHLDAPLHRRIKP